MTRYALHGLLALLAVAMTAGAASAQVTVLTGENDFQTPSPTMINFEDIALCSPAPCTTFFNVDRYQPQGVHIADGTSSSCSMFTCDLTVTSAAAAWSGTVGGMASGCPFTSCFVAPHSGGVGIADSDSAIPSGCVVLRFVQPGTTTLTSVLEAGFWVHAGKEDDCVQFFDASQNQLIQLTAPADQWTFIGVRATQGIRYIRYLGAHIGLPNGGGFLIDDLKFGGTVSPNAPPVITQGASTNLSVRCNSNCPLAANQVTLNATDPDGNAAQLMWSIQTSPTRGALSPTTGTGAAFTVCYDPNNAQMQSDSFIVRVTDTGGASDSITVNVTLTNDAPVITQGASVPLSVSRNSVCGCPSCIDTANQVALSATDLETAAASLQWTVSTPPATGAACFQGGVQTGGSVTLRYTPNAGQSSPDSFVVRVADDCSGVDTITVNVTVVVPCSAAEKGDLNYDGVVSARDIERFTQVLINPASATATDKCRADIGGASPNFCTADALNNPDDIAGFILILLGGACNLPPVITQGEGASLSVAVNSNCPNAANNLALSATDADGPLASLSWSIQVSPATGTLTPTSGTGGSFTVCYDPANSQAAADFFIVRVTDALGGTDSIPVNVTVENQAPVIAQGDTFPLLVGQSTDCPNAANNVALSATDPDGLASQLAWSIQVGPTRGAVSPTSGTGGSFTVCYDPNNGQSLPDSFVVRVADPLGASDTITVNVTVDNLPPVITEGASANLSVAVNSNCPNAANNLTLNATDPDGPAGSLAWSIQTPPATGSLTPTSGSGGSFTVCYDPNDGQAAADSFVVKVADPAGAMDTILINVSLTNQPPVITQGASTNLAVGNNTDCPNPPNNLTLDATDADGPPASLSWSIQTPPATGTLTPTSGTGGSFTVCYDPNNGQSAADSFVVRVTDSFGGADTITVNVSVQNNPPQITNPDPASMTVDKDSFCGFPGNELTLNATDELPASLAWSIMTPAAHGLVSFTTAATGPSVTVCYEPDPKQCQSDSFVVKVTDNILQTDTITVNVTVNNLPPDITVGVGGQLFLQVTRNTTCPNANNNVTITAVDADGPNSSLTWSIMTPPVTGTVTPTTGSGGTFIVCYQPNPNQTASDSYVVKVTDICGGSDTVTVNVTVVP